MTRSLRFFTVLPKTYVGQLVLGRTTTTLDDTGDTLANFQMDSVTLGDVRSVARRYVGEISQIPPMVSAIKVDGKRLHELAREGIEIERKARVVTIHSLLVADHPESGVFELTVTCSSGTYIRTLADDMARSLGGGGHLRSLRRTQIGSFTLDDAVELPPRDVDLTEPLNLLEPVAALSDYPQLVVDAHVESLVGNGVVLRSEQLGDPANKPLVLVSARGSLLAIYESSERGWKPAFVVPVQA